MEGRASGCRDYKRILSHEARPLRWNLYQPSRIIMEAHRVLTPHGEILDDLKLPLAQWVEGVRDPKQEF